MRTHSSWFDTQDLKQPLSRIRVQVQLLQRSLSRQVHPHHESMELWVQRLLETTEEMNAQLNRIMDPAHLGVVGARLTNCGPTDLVGLVRTCAEDVAQADAPVEIRLESQVQALIIPCDAALIRAAVANVISNAVKHTAATCPVVIRVDIQRASECHEVVVSVSDSGVGTPAMANKQDVGTSVGVRVPFCGARCKLHPFTARIARRVAPALRRSPDA